MLIEMIINNFLSLIDYLPTLDISTTIQMYETFFEYVDMAAYFIPMNDVKAILEILILEELFKIVLSVIKLVLSFIPFMGGG